VINHLYEDEVFITDRATLFPDSIAVHTVLRFLYKKKYLKLVCTDLLYSLIEKANKSKKKIFFFGDNSDTLNELLKIVKNEYKHLIVAGFSEGYEFCTERVISEINDSKADILFVALGVRRQERWILENYNKLHVPLIFSVGGWFQYLSKKKKRAPIFIRRLNLEWLYKLVNEFTRVAGRYLIGVPKFYYRVLSGKVKFKMKNV
jgi:N-acetylglucosaminyldiphosphoundecaprenol N-acetyl-beta-D-mannosaminyltransferase